MQLSSPESTYMYCVIRLDRALNTRVTDTVIVHLQLDSSLTGMADLTDPKINEGNH